MLIDIDEVAAMIELKFRSNLVPSSNLGSSWAAQPIALNSPM